MARIIASDVFVVLDDVLFRKAYFHNRTVISDGSGGYRLLTLPVHYHSSILLRDVTTVGSDINNGIFLKIINSYERYATHSAFLRSIGRTIYNGDHLVDINLSLISIIFEYLDFSGRTFVLSSSIHASSDRTQRLIDICRYIGGTNLLIGWGAMSRTHNLDRISAAGINISQQVPSECEKGENTPLGLSIIDHIFRRGALHTRTALIDMASQFVPLTKVL